MLNRKWVLGALMLAMSVLFASVTHASVLLVSGYGAKQVYKSTNGGADPLVGLPLPSAADGTFGPTGIAVAPDGRVYVNDYDNGRIFRYDANFTNPTVVSTGLANPEGAAFGPDGKLYIAQNSGSAGIARFITTPGGLTPDGVFFDSAPAGSNGQRIGVAFLGNDLYVSENGPQRVFKFQNITTSGGGGLAGTTVLSSADGINVTHGLLFDSSGRLLTANFSGDEVARYDLSNNNAKTSFSFTGPVGLGISPDDGKLYVSSFTQNKVDRYAYPGMTFDSNAATINGLGGHFLTFSNVPEPGVLSLVSLSGAAMLKRRSRRCACHACIFRGRGEGTIFRCPLFTWRPASSVNAARFARARSRVGVGRPACSGGISTLTPSNSASAPKWCAS